MRISDWSSDVCSSDLLRLQAAWRESGRLKALGAGLPAGRVPERKQWGPSPRATPASRTLAGGERSALDAGALVFAPRSRGAQSHLPRRLSAVAAVAVVAIALALGWRVHSPPVHQVTYGPPVGALETASLADGSEATLSSDSRIVVRSEEHTSELQSLMRISYAVLCLKKKN